MNTLLIAEMFDGDRMQVLAAIQPAARPTHAVSDLPKCVLEVDSGELLPGPPPASAQPFDLIRV